MIEAVVVVALVVAGGATGVFVVMVIGIHIEDSRKSITDRPPGMIAAGTRRILHLNVDHTSCQYVSNPRNACPTCRRTYTQQQ